MEHNLTRCVSSTVANQRCKNKAYKQKLCFSHFKKYMSDVNKKLLKKPPRYLRKTYSQAKYGGVEEEKKMHGTLAECVMSAIQNQTLPFVKITSPPNCEAEYVYLKSGVVSGNIYWFKHRFLEGDYLIFAVLYKNPTDNIYKCNLYVLEYSTENLRIYPDGGTQVPASFITTKSVGTGLYDEDYLEIERNYVAVDKPEIKHYCVELMDIHNPKRGEIEVWINWIQNCPWCHLPNNNKCAKLKGIFGLLRSLFVELKFGGAVYLQDDSRWFGNCTQPGEGLLTAPLRLLNHQASIYGTYGFKPVDSSNAILNYDSVVNTINQYIFRNKQADGSFTANTIESIIKVDLDGGKLTNENKHIYVAILNFLKTTDAISKSMAPYFQLTNAVKKMMCPNDVMYDLWNCSI